MTVLADLSQVELLAKVAELEAKIERQRMATQRKLTLKVTQRKADGSGTDGAISLYGLGRFPITLYKSQWQRLLGEAEHIKQFMLDNSAALAEKGE